MGWSDTNCAVCHLTHLHIIYQEIKAEIINSFIVSSFDLKPSSVYSKKHSIGLAVPILLEGSEYDKYILR